MTDWLRRAKELIRRGADPARVADQTGGTSYIINKIDGWQTRHLLIVALGGVLIGTIAMVGLVSISGVRLANPREAVILEATANLEGTIVAMPRQELIARLAVPMKLVRFASGILRLDSSAPSVAPPDWLTRLGLRDHVGTIYSAAPKTRADAVKFVVDFLTGLPAGQQSVALGQWARFVAVGEDPAANNLLWKLANLSNDQLNALLRAGFPPVPNDDESRQVYVMLAHAKRDAVTACWTAMKRNELNDR